MGLFDDIGKAISGAANTVVTTASQVATVASESALLQTVGAVATGGLSLVAQGVIAGVTGQSNPFTQAVADVAADPWNNGVKQIPGLVLGELGLPGAVATAGKLGGALVGGLTGNQVFTDIGEGISTTQKVLRDDPALSLGIVAGAAGLAFGIPGAAGLLGGQLGAGAIKTVAELGAKSKNVIAGPSAAAAALGAPPHPQKHAHVVKDFWPYFGRTA